MPHEQSTCLSGKTVLVTRQPGQSAELIAEIEKRGGHAVVSPAITIADPDSWDECDRALLRLETYDCLIFTSMNGVKRFFTRCSQKGIDAGLLRRCVVFAVGPQTKREIENHGLTVRFVPEEFSSSGLNDCFAASDVRNKRFLFPRGNLGGNILVARLIQLGAAVDTVTVYRTAKPRLNGSEPVLQHIARGEVDVVTFASPSAARNFAEMLPVELLEQLRGRTLIAVIGPATEKAVRGLGLLPQIVAVESTSRGLVEAIAAHFGGS